MIFHPTMRQSPEGFNCDYTIKADILMLFTTAQELKVLGTLKIGDNSDTSKKIPANPNEDSC